MSGNTWVEFMQYEPSFVGRGVEIDVNGEDQRGGSVCGR